MGGMGLCRDCGNEAGEPHEPNCLVAENRMLRDLLGRVEWAGDFCDEPACPVCLGVPHKGHAKDCELAAALEGT